MNHKAPTKGKGPLNKPALPPQAEAEILDRLFTNMRISSGEIAFSGSNEMRRRHAGEP